MDSSSITLEAIRYAQVKSLPVIQCLHRGIEALSEIMGYGGLPPYRCPTFLTDDCSDQSCPIISARVLRLVNLQAHERQAHAESIIEDVTNGDWVSPWFAPDSMTKGLCLWYLASLLRPNHEHTNKLINELSNRAHSQNKTSTEEWASLALGLGAGLGICQDDNQKKIVQDAWDQCINQLLGSERDGCWDASDTGEFGFGIRYSDPLLTTCLASCALIEAEN